MSTTAGDLASRPAATCRSADTVEQVARVMSERNVGSVVVVDDDRRPIGMITDRDLVLRVLSQGRDGSLGVAEAMTREVATVTESASPLDAARQMMVRSCRRLPVVSDDTGRVVGVISADDVLNRASEEVDAITHCLAPRRRQLLTR